MMEVRDAASERDPLEWNRFGSRSDFH